MAEHEHAGPYVGWELRLPARFFGAAWAKKEYGDTWQLKEWVVEIITYRKGSRKVAEEWCAANPPDEDVYINRTWMNKFQKEGRLTGDSFCAIFAPCVIFFVVMLLFFFFQNPMMRMLHSNRVGRRLRL